MNIVDCDCPTYYTNKRLTPQKTLWSNVLLSWRPVLLCLVYMLLGYYVLYSKWPAGRAYKGFLEYFLSQCMCTFLYISWHMIFHKTKYMKQNLIKPQQKKYHHSRHMQQGLPGNTITIWILTSGQILLSSSKQVGQVIIPSRKVGLVISPADSFDSYLQKYKELVTQWQETTYYIAIELRPTL